MYKVHKLLNANASYLTASGSADTLEDAITTAGGGSSLIPTTVDSFDLLVESGSIRALWDGNDPSSSRGMLYPTGSLIKMRGVKPSKFKFTKAEAGNALLTVQVGHVPVNPGGQPIESSSVSNINQNEISVAIDEFPASSVATDAEDDPDTTSIKAFPYVYDNASKWKKLRGGISAIITDITGFLNNVAYGQYNATPLTLADQEWSPEQVASDGSKKVFQTSALDPDNDSVTARSSSAGVQRTSALASTLFAYNGAVGFKQCIGHNTNAAQSRYVMVFDRTTAPSVGAVDWKYMYKCAAQGDGFVSLGDLDYEAFVNGIYIVTSSSDTSYQTAGVGSEMSFQVIYETI